MDADACPQAWHGGLAAELPVKLLIECRYAAKHRGKHRSESGDLEWSGKLTDAEHAQADELRALTRAGDTPTQ